MEAVRYSHLFLCSRGRHLPHVSGGTGGLIGRHIAMAFSVVCNEFFFVSSFVFEIHLDVPC